MKTLLASASMLLLLSGCPVRRDHGLGECTEYTPACFTAPIRCVADERGCQVCTCDEWPSPPPDAP